MQFENQSIIITGAGSGIGQAAAIEFAKRGGKVVVSDINEEGGKETVATILANGGEAIFVKTDVTNNSEVEALIQECVDTYGTVNHMVNNAGIGLGHCFFDQISDEKWEKTIAVNQTGVFYCMRAVLKVMKAQRQGSIVNIASVAGIGAAPRMGAYAASKFAVVGMTKTVASEYGKYNIRVNAICPSVIETPLADSYMDPKDPVAQMMKSMVPMKRFGQAEEVGKTICWLCSEDASYLNGVALPIDGGFTA